MTGVKTESLRKILCLTKLIITGTITKVEKQGDRYNVYYDSGTVTSGIHDQLGEYVIIEKWIEDGNPIEEVPEQDE